MKFVASLPALALCTLPAITTAADIATSVPAASAEYRLNIGNVTDYRLNNGRDPALTATTQSPAAAGGEARPDAAPSPRFADRPFASLIAAAAREAALDPALVHAVIAVESGYNATARSPKGALGLMQVMPDTGLRYGVRHTALLSPADNLRAGTRYLVDLMELFDKRLDLVLAAYNAGEKTVQRYGLRIPPYPETQNYVPAVLARYHQWREIPPVAPPPAAVPVRIQYMPGTVLDAAFSQDAGRR
jgi:soluble lytic murein transglycosylase-like protein